jgi:hypothetical protein
MSFLERQKASSLALSKSAQSIPPSLLPKPRTSHSRRQSPNGTPALVEANKTIEGLKAAAIAQAEEHKKALEAKDKEVDLKASKKAGVIVEQSGVPPVTGEKTEASQNPSQPAKESPNLKGMDRVIAALKSESQKK